MDIVIALLVIAFFFRWVAATSYDLGVEDTEKRWSAAVSKGEWERKYGGG